MITANYLLSSGNSYTVKSNLPLCAPGPAAPDRQLGSSGIAGIASAAGRSGAAQQLTGSSSQQGRSSSPAQPGAHFKRKGGGAARRAEVPVIFDSFLGAYNFREVFFWRGLVV